MELPMHKSVHNNLIKAEIDETLYSALEDASKTSF